MINQTIAHYRITAKLGQGGMGEVYRATDTKLDRDVAIKVLPDEFADSPERLSRFQREAKVLAKLNHPNIATIHGFEKDQDKRFLVMELAKGQTLSECISRKPLPVGQALEVFQQIAQALEAAHDAGIIHRDLKPANVVIGPNGRVKVLDFGLAKALQSPSDPSAAAPDAATATLSCQSTLPGKIMGTAAYMSPEQSRGQKVDKRTDVWAFGCCLYEALTGRQPFAGQTTSDLLAAILKTDPDFTIIPPETPSEVLSLLRRCLEKEPRRRLRDLGDIALALDDVTETSRISSLKTVPDVARTKEQGTLSKLIIGLVAGATITGICFWAFYSNRPSSTKSESKTPRLIHTQSILTADLQSIPLALSKSPTLLAISPDGSTIVFVGFREGISHLYQRPLGENKVEIIPESRKAYTPFFSDDGKYLGYVAGLQMRYVPVAGGPSTFICTTEWVHGASWRGRTILFNLAPAKDLGLHKVDIASGESNPFTLLDSTQNELNHFWPQILPGGEAVVYSARTSGDLQESRIMVKPIEGGEPKVLIPSASLAKYASSGHLVYSKGGSLWAAPFSLEQLALEGTTVEVRDDLMVNPFFRNEMWDLSESDGGTLVFVAESKQPFGRKLVSVDREGNRNDLPLKVDAYQGVQISPKDNRLAVTIGGTGSDIWILDLDSPERSYDFIDDPRDDFCPAWSPDGEWLYFCSDREGIPDIYRIQADGRGKAEVFVSSPAGLGVPSVSSNVLAFRNSAHEDIWILRLGGEHEEEAFLDSPTDVETDPAVSPDGKRLAYSSDRNQKDKFEIYVIEFDNPQRGGPISEGKEPVWSHNGQELFFRKGDDLMVVTNDAEIGLKPSTPRTLVEGLGAIPARPIGGTAGNTYDVTPDGKNFIVITEAERPLELKQLIVVQNWFEELRRLAPAD